MMRRLGSLAALAGRGTAPCAVGARFFAVLLVFASITGPGVVAAAPAAPRVQPAVRFEIPGWLGAEGAARLDLGFDVLVPWEVPAPFDGEPAIDAYDGYYSLYWLIAGAPPTYLLITGEVGGAIPDFSYYDRNVQLEVNAEVQGIPAYHDLTPIYDKVYWQVGDIVYTVDSHNLSSTDSLTLANSLFPLGGTPLPTPTRDTDGSDSAGNRDDEAPTPVEASLSVPESVESGEVVAIRVGGVDDGSLSADAGTFPAVEDATLSGVGAGSYDWRAPESETDLTVTFTLSDGGGGEPLATAQTVVKAAVPPEPVAQASIRCPVLATAGEKTRISVGGIGTLTVDASDGTFPAEPPNTDFAPDADGSDALTGTLPERDTFFLTWLAPEAAMTAYFFIYDPAGNTLAECGTEVTFDEIASPTPEPTKTGERGDGSQPPDALSAIVAQVVAYTRSPSGDATGEPNATTAPSKSEGDGAAAPTPSPPTPTPGPPKPTVAPTATLAPATGTDGMVAQVIGPEGGDLRCPSGSGAMLTIPPAALKEPSTVTIRPVADGKLPVSSSVDLVAGTAFDITIASANGESVEHLDAPATLTIALPKGAADPNLMLYRVSGTQLEPLSGVSVDGATISVPLNGFSRIVAGLPTPSAPASTTQDPMPFVLAALGFVVALMAIFALGSVLLRRRPRTVTPRRTLPGRARIR
jgi:hypothetical protein